MLAKFRNLAFSLGILLLILACSSPAPTATPYTPPEPTTLPGQGPGASVAPMPVLTPEPVLTATPAPTAMPASTIAPQPTAAPQPVTETTTATPAPLPTATTAPLPTPTPTPTPAPPPTATPPPPPTPTPTPDERDRAILTAFYHAMDGPNWANSTNWLTDSPLSEWYGVSLGRNSGVVWLLLPSNRLKGEIPAELGDLPALENLDLSRNLLLGCIPLTLVYHKYLYEYGSPNFGGILKPCENPDRAALVSFYHATGGPDWAESENWLTDAPIGDWHGVDVVDGYDDEGEIGRVKSLSLASNGLTGEVPAAALADLAELRSLNLRGLTPWEARDGMPITNQLRGAIPPELGNLVNLQSLSLANNQLTGEIPPELGNLVNLQSLSLANNQLTGEIPPELGNLVNLDSLAGGGLNLSRNQLTGEIPPELGNLQSLSLANNQLTGAIPPELGNLQSLNLADNQLTGAIPPELGNLVNLRGLYLANNQLTGAIPPELGNLGNLEWLYLAGNRLTGAIPTELGNLSNLRSLDLADNLLTGAIPPELVFLTGLAYPPPRLEGNQFSGCVSRPLEQIGVDPAELGLEWCQ